MGWGRKGGSSSSSSRLLLVAGETQRRMRPPLRWLRQWQRCLAFRARGQGGASHHLPTKAQVTQPAPPPSPNISPSFLPSPHQLTSPQAQLRKLRASHHPLPSSSFSSTSTPPPPPRWRPLQSLGFHRTAPLSKNRGFSLCSQPLLSHFLSFLFLPVIYI